MFVFALLAVSDVFWGSVFSAVALVAAAWISRSNTKKLTSIDDAVNHKEHGMPTLVQRVIDQDERSMKVAEELAEFRKWQVQYSVHPEGAPKPIPPRDVLLPVGPPPVGPASPG